jgi:RNA polymerase primary sigma factor
MMARATVTVPRDGASSLSSYFLNVGDTKLLQADEERELALRVQEGDSEARDHFVRANLRFVVMVARQYVGRHLSLDDLIQEGNLGLVHAVEQFDPYQNVRFSTYARYWIRQSIQQAVERQAPAIRVPGYAVDLVSKWRQASRRLHDELGRPPTEDEIAAVLELSGRQLKIIKKALRIYNNLGSATLTDSMDSPSLHDLEDDPSGPGASCERADELQHVLQLIDRLEEREADIIRKRFGLGGKSPMVLSEIGQQLGLTRERVRQIERQALAKLHSWIDTSND